VEDQWGLGCYEETAEELAPASEDAVAALGLAGGERVLDLACGNGNAAAVAAGRGARVVGLDSSPRLVGLARERLPEVEFVLGDAAELPFADGEFDAAVSVFGVVFVSPAERAAAELVRVVRPGGRVVVTSWASRGPTFEAVLLMRQALARVRPPEGPPPMNWGDPTVLQRLLGPHGELEVHERELIFENAKAEDVWDRWERSHPMWSVARRVLQPAGEWERLREDSIAVLREGASADGGARSPYLLAVLTRR
jgi:SAM-dependent methyltransferase